MTARPLPWMKFSPDRWQRDEALRMCSAAARGVWMELMCIMHRAEPYGHLLVRGKQPSDRQLSVIAGIPVIELSTSLAELEANEVFDRNEAGVIFCRGMVRDKEVHEEMSRRGSKGQRVKQQNEKGKTGGLSTGSSTGRSTGSSLESEIERESEKDSPPVVPLKGEKTQIPDDWGPQPFGADSQAAAIIAAWSEDRFASEAEAFKSHHRAKGSRYLDWQQAWGTWVNNKRSFAAEREQRAASTPSRSYADTVLAEIEGRAPAKVTAK